MQDDLFAASGEAGKDDPHRLFFALWPDVELRQGIATIAAKLEGDCAPGGRRLRADRYHLTLQYLGDYSPFPQVLVTQACAAADTLCLSAFDLQLDRAGSFAGSQVWWLGTQLLPDGLQRLWDGLGHALAKARVRVISPPGFTPHLTVQRDVRKLIPLTPVEPLAWPVREFVLIDSQPGRPYTVLRRWPLRI